MVFSVTPAKAYAHAKGDPFGATTHKFSPHRDLAMAGEKATTQVRLKWSMPGRAS